jgi:acylphosphatase
MTLENTLHKSIRISGRVQGVGFRYSARSMASTIGIKGFVRNLPNGDVYIEVEGSFLQLEEYIQWCRQGPPRAKIKVVDVYDAETVGFEAFDVRY